MAALLTKLIVRNDTSTNWTAQNPVLLKGEIGIEWTTTNVSVNNKNTTDTSDDTVSSPVCKFKIGDGTTAWTSLQYYGGTFSITGTGNTIVDASYSASTGTLTLTKGDRVASVAATAGNTGVVVSKTGTTAVSITVSHATSGANATKGPSADVTIGTAGATATIAVPKLTADSYGHVTSLSEQTLTIHLPSLSELGIAGAYVYKGSCTWAQLIAKTNQEVGWVWSITDEDPNGNVGQNWACKTKVGGTAPGSSYATYWDNLGGTVNLTNYATLDGNNHFTGANTIDSLVAGNLVVTGGAQFNGSLVGNLTGNADSATTAANAVHAGSAGYATEAAHSASATYANSANSAAHATHAGSAGYASSAGSATSASQATHAASAAYAASSNCAAHATHAGSAGYATSASEATHAASAAYAASSNCAAHATHAGSAGYATSAASATYAAGAGNADTLDNYHLHQVQDCYTTTSDRTAHLSVTIPDVTELYDGLTIRIMLNTGYDTSYYRWTLNVNNLGEKLIWYRRNEPLTSHVSQYAILTLTYKADAGSTSISSGMTWSTLAGTTQTSGWIMQTAYNSDSGDYSLRLFYAKTGSSIRTYSLVGMNANGMLVDICDQNPIRPELPIALNNSGSTYNSGVDIDWSGFYLQHYALLVRYKGTNKTWTNKEPIYIKGTVSNGFFTAIATDPYVQSLPTTDDGYAYMYVGFAYSTTYIDLQLKHPVYWFKNGAWRQYLGDDYIANGMDAALAAATMDSATIGNLVVNGAANFNNGLTGTLSGQSSCAVYAGSATSASQAVHAASAAWATYASSAGYAASSNCASHAIHAGSAGYASSAGSTTTASEAVHAASAAWATYASSAGYATTASIAGTSISATNAMHAQTAHYASSASWANLAGTATHAQGAYTATYSSSAGYATTANVARYMGNNYFIAYPGGGAWTGTDGSVTGCVKITLPVSWTSTMMSMWVDIYNYSTNTPVSYFLGGYNYGDKYWVNTFATSIANNASNKKNLTVRFGHDGSKCCIYIGETNTNWSYPHVVVRDVQLGHSNVDFNTWYSGWTVTFTTSMGTISGTTVTNPWMSNTAANAINADTLDGHHASEMAFQNTNATFTSVTTDSATIGNIAVTGSANFTNIINGSIVYANSAGYAASAGRINLTSTDNNVPRFDGTAGNLQSSRWYISDTGAMSLSDGTNTKTSLIDFKNYSTYGIDTKICSGALMVVGAGESGDSAFADSSNVAGESLWLTADSGVYIASNGDTWANRQVTSYSTAGNWSMPHGLTVGTTTANENNTTTINGKMVINPSYNTAENSYNEGLIINQASNGWSEIAIGGSAGTTSGLTTSTWILARRGVAGSFAGAAGDFTIEDGSEGKGLTLKKSSGGAILYTNVASNVASWQVINSYTANASSHYLYGGNYLAPNMSGSSHNILLIGKANSSKNSGYIGWRHTADASDNNGVVIGVYGNDDLFTVRANGNVGVGTTAPDNKLQVANGKAKAQGFIMSTQDTNNTTKATMQYNSTDDCIEFVFS